MKKYLFLILIFFSFFLVLEKASWQKQEARLIFFSVGQGDASLFISPQGKTLLIDGGPCKTVSKKLSSYLKSRQKNIDWVVLTHGHDDHYLGLIAASKYYNFSKLIFPNWTRNQLLIDWRYQLENKNSQIVEVRENIKRVYLEENCYFDVLASPLLFKEKIENVLENDLSFSVKIDCYNIVALFTGDLELAGEKALLKKAPDDFLSATIFQAGHHGSNTSNSIEFLEAVNPDLVVISAGKNNSYGHPGERTLKNIESVKARIYRTDIDGDIEILSNNKEIIVNTEF